ncbi:endonuclease/exonuclease/phosphatase family protein [Bowmanella dokdonensis]|uniref:Endonuclease/exonuclease/phosphatase family protein n=1 Tax=Bowmanella dokdonensis TaxID=751969 RepID=A0A939ISR6_9ALTE|nr:endonuclease/exonuclease/phosphatase family protein [Bowmanella dokdonensis]MBN7826711.1 endonuclease/exonuclease/phosphatase family protein [Bowmanella dokdonensis]
MLINLFCFLNLLLVAFCLIPLLHSEAWYVRALAFPRLQFSALALLMLLLEFALLDLTRPASALLICVSAAILFYQARWILPYTPLFDTEVKAAPAETNPTLSIIAANVYTPNRNAAKLIEIVRREKPDILVTLESDQWWQDQLDALLPSYPHSIQCPLDNLYGMHLYSRLALENGHIRYLVDQGVPSIHVAVTMPTGQKVEAHFIHPTPPAPPENTRSLERDVELLIVARQVKAQDCPVVVAGDLNDVAWSRTTRLFRKVSGLLDPRIGRGMFNTFHARCALMRWPLDHLFHSRHFRLKEIRRLEAFGSDHFPLLTRLALMPDSNENGQAPDMDRGDKQLVDEKLAQKEADKHSVPTPLS